MIELSHANAVEVEKAFTRPRKWLGWSIMSALIAMVLGRSAEKAAAMASYAHTCEQILKLGNFAGRLGVVEQGVDAVEHRQAAPEIVVPRAEVVTVPELIEPTGVSLPTTIHVPKKPVPTPPYAPPQIGKVPFFEEAAADIISRQPVVVQNPLKRTAGEVGKLYREDHVFALAKSADLAITKRVQQIVADGITEGLTVDEAVKRIMEVNADWTRAYAETVYRTNLATAQTEGRFQQAAKPGMEKILPLMVFRTVGDGRVRPNHKAADGAAAPPGHFMWDVIRPPLGYNCRCRVQLVSWEMGRRMGLISPDGEISTRAPKHGAGTDPGFTHSGRSRWMP